MALGQQGQLGGRFRIYPSKMASEGARSLKNALNSLLVRPDGHYKPLPQDIIINWGMSQTPIWAKQAVWAGDTVVNHWDCVATAIRKDLTFAILKEFKVSIPYYTTNSEHAYGQLIQGNCVFARKTLTGTRGQGIVVMKSIDDFIEAPLYTKFERKCKEYRVHVAFGQVIDFQQKKRRNGGEADAFIRNHDNGWVFARQDVVLPEGVGEVSVNAIKALGLAFGGVDILHRPTTGDTYVLEINTAPGLEGSTLDSYVKAFKQLLK